MGLPPRLSFAAPQPKKMKRQITQQAPE